nr:hypothetical protein GCM10020092_097680 [Actinoplanes digitatis]
MRRWERQLDWSQSDAEKFSRNVLPVLAELADERLRLKHGITRSSDPRRARELLGEPLWGVSGRAGPARAEGARARHLRRCTRENLRGWFGDGRERGDPAAVRGAQDG